jgi:hypothetical protein
MSDDRVLIWLHGITPEQFDEFAALKQELVPICGILDKIVLHHNGRQAYPGR